MNDPWGRFTARGGVKVEQKITSVVSQVASLVRGTLPEQNIDSLLLIGGYGRGEGGVEIRDNAEHPHNNLDFLVVTCGLNRVARATLQYELDLAVKPLVADIGVGIDFSVISSRKLKTFPCEVMWYDVRHGHKTILGSGQLVQSLDHLRLESIAPASIRDLLVNRGTLLVINELLLSKSTLTEADLRTLIKHSFKAIIGYGDAELFFQGKYHWSYLERQRRMRKALGVGNNLRDLYEEAIEFRFQPNYQKYAEHDLPFWLKSIRNVLAPVHLQCESRRLRSPSLEWPQYPYQATQSAFDGCLKSPRSALRVLVNSIRHRNWKSPLPELSNISLRALGLREMLAIAHPVVAYGLPSPAHRNLVRVMLGATSAEMQDLRIEYIKAWGCYGDSNFSAVAERLGLSSLINNKGAS